MTLGSHQKCVGDSQAWITPRWLIDAVGPFDLDPCAADPRPWDCAANNFTADGLEYPWNGRVWLNPPFNRYEVGKWIAKLAQHRRGVALVHARTEAEWFEPIWRSAVGILFLADRIKFYRPDGTQAASNSGAPVCLVAFSGDDCRLLKASGIDGNLLHVWERVGERARAAA